MQGTRERAAARRLMAAVLLPRLLGQLKGAPLDARDDPAQLADLLSLLRKDPDFVRLGHALLEVPDDARTERTPRFASLWLTIQDRLPARGHHHLAVLQVRWGWACVHHQPADASRRWLRALKHFSRVLADRAFFKDLALAVGSPSRAGWLHTQAPRLWLAPHIDTLIAAASGEPDASHDALAVHWKVLTQAPKEATRADVEAPVLRAIEDVVQETKRRIIDATLDRAETLTRDLDPMLADAADVAAPFDHLRAITEFTGPQEPLSIWAIERAVKWAWPLYKGDQQDRLKPIIERCRPFGAHLEALLRRGNGAFGRQSVCADYLLFVADFRDAPEEELLIQRALNVCPGHRNARLMLSHIKLRKANKELRKVEAREVISQYLNAKSAREALDRAEALINTAAELYPENSNLDSYRERVAKARSAMPAK